MTLSPRRRRAAERLFRRARGELEARFSAAAGRDGKPAGLRWVRCEFAGDPRFAPAADGRLDGFLSVTVQFEPIPGGGMEDVPAAHLPRHAAAVFHHRPGPRWAPWSAGTWGTGGRALFNLTAEQAAGRATAAADGGLPDPPAAANMPPPRPRRRPPAGPT